ncbi:MAG: hypothetical protein SLagBPW_30040 [Shewanella algae]
MGNNFNRFAHLWFAFDIVNAAGKDPGVMPQQGFFPAGSKFDFEYHDAPVWSVGNRVLMTRLTFQGANNSLKVGSPQEFSTTFSRVFGTFGRLISPLE